MHSENEKKIITRFAPSPTGFLHGGNYRTAVFSYLFARQHDGEFIVRIEDTDRERSKKEFEENIFESLAWLNLENDATYRQSDLLEQHSLALQTLITNNHAYVSREEAKDGSGVIRELVRFRNPAKLVTFTDLIRGEIEINTTDLGDFVIAKSLTEPLFHIAVVVDDASMGVTHVIRGEDHIANTPRQILLHEALGYPIPQYAHLPLVLDEKRTKLSKRKGAESLTYYRDNGYLPQAVLNFLALLGWNPGTEQEIFTKNDLMKSFSLDRVQKSSGIFNIEKLNWINKEHIKLLSREEQLQYIQNFLPITITENPDFTLEKLQSISDILIEHITHFGQISEMAKNNELSFYFSQPNYSKEKLFWKEDRDEQKLLGRLAHVLEIIDGIEDSTFNRETFKSSIWEYATAEGRGQVLWPLRYALSGCEKSPDPFQLAEVFGKKETMKRITFAINLYHGNTNA